RWDRLRRNQPPAPTGLTPDRAGWSDGEVSNTGLGPYEAHSRAARANPEQGATCRSRARPPATPPGPRPPWLAPSARATVQSRVRGRQAASGPLRAAPRTDSRWRVPQPRAKPGPERESP